MSSDNLLKIVRKNGGYQVRHEAAPSLAHALAGVEPTEDDLLIEVLANDVPLEKA